MGNWNPNYFEKKAGSLEEAILNAVNGVKTQINEDKVVTDLEDDPKLFKDIAKMGVKVKKLGKPEDGYVEVELSGPKAKIDAANKKLNLLPESKIKEGSKEEYKKFFDGAMKKFGIDSPADLKSDEEKKKFFDYVDKNYKGEKDEAYHAKIKEWSGVKESYEIGTSEYTNHTKKITPGQGEADWNETVVNIHKKQTSMREALAKMWGIDEGKSPFGEKEEVKPKKEGKTLTGKPMTKVDVNPDIKEK